MHIYAHERDHSISVLAARPYLPMKARSFVPEGGEWKAVNGGHAP